MSICHEFYCSCKWTGESKCGAGYQQHVLQTSLWTDRRLDVKCTGVIAPFCRLLVNVWLISDRILWRGAVQYSAYEHGLWQQLWIQIISLLTSWVDLVKLFNFSVLVPPSVYNEDGDDKSYLMYVGVRLKWANICIALTTVSIPK